MSARQIIKRDVSASISAALTLALLCLVGGLNGLHLTKMDTPYIVDVRKEMELNCEFDLGKEYLYAVKWYKDNREFFRYMPGPKVTTYDVPNVHVLPDSPDCGNDHCNLKLFNLTKKSSGQYTCEICGEGPQFRLVYKTNEVIVAALLLQNPKIIGLSSSYLEGDLLEAKCVSDRTDPPAILSWYINGKPVPLQVVGPTVISEPDSLGLVASSINLTLLIDNNLGRESVIDLKCESNLADIIYPPKSATYRLQIANQSINNQKLFWFGSSISSRSLLYLPTISLFILIVSIHWGISKVIINKHI